MNQRIPHVAYGDVEEVPFTRFVRAGAVASPHRPLPYPRAPRCALGLALAAVGGLKEPEPTHCTFPDAFFIVAMRYHVAGWMSKQPPTGSRRRYRSRSGVYLRAIVPVPCGTCACCPIVLNLVRPYRTSRILVSTATAVALHDMSCPVVPQLEGT